ncbi:hypothetical protein C3L33_23286, partial [Rhododendron williamsianum]
MFGNAFVIQKLVDDENGNNSSVVKNEDLFGRNNKGNTPLHEAARFGRASVVETLLRKQESLVRERNNSGETPVYVAATCGHEDVFNHLIAKVDRDWEIMTRGTDNSNVLQAAVVGEHYGLAMSILELFPELAQNHDKEGRTALYLLAKKSKSFRSGSFYSPHNYMAGSLILSVHLLTILIYSCGRTKRIYDEKQKHAFALQLGQRLVKEEREWSRYLEDHMGSPIVEATKRGIIELVNEILRKFPEAAYSFDKNNNNNDEEENILRIAVEQKNWNMYILLKSKVELMRDGMLVGDVDKHGNTILHLAAKLGTTSSTLVQRGHLYQMVWDVCWFKQVSYDSPPHLGYLQNSNGETAAEAFMKEHSETREKAEKAVKYMNNGLMLISTLIGSVNYAALLTPPGGLPSRQGRS